MIKKLFFYNQIIFLLIIIVIIISPIYLEKKSKAKEYLIPTQNSFEVYFVNNTYIVTTFDGCGGWLYGGIFPGNTITHIDKMSNQELEELVENHSVYRFPTKSFPDNAGLYIGNYDIDKNIEIFAYEFLDTTFLQPIEITLNGDIKEENIFVKTKLLIIASFLMLPNFIFYSLFIMYYFIVCIIYVIVKIKNRKKV